MELKLGSDKDWLEGVRRVISPNCDERTEGGEINLLVIHGISLPPKQYGGPYIDQLFCNCLDASVDPYFNEICDLKVSSHLLINRQGEITQYVPFSKRAWHAGVSEFKGRQVCNDFSIGIELEGCDDVAYEIRQYEAAAVVIKLLMKQWPGISPENVVGHSTIAPGRKTDPGPAFDWDYLTSLLDKD